MNKSTYGGLVAIALVAACSSVHYSASPVLEIKYFYVAVDKDGKTSGAGPSEVNQGARLRCLEASARDKLPSCVVAVGDAALTIEPGKETRSRVAGTATFSCAGEPPSTCYIELLQ